MELPFWFYVLLSSITFIIWYLKKTFTFWSNLGVPQFPIKLPHGNFKGVGNDISFSDFLVHFYQRTKNIGARFSGIYTFHRSIFFVTDLDLIKTLLVKDFNVFPNRGIYYNEKDDPVSAHIFSLDSEPWRGLRQKLTPTFTSGKLKMMFPTLSNVTDKLLETIEKQTADTAQLEVKDILARFTTDVIGTTAFGIDCNSLEDKNSPFYVMGSRIFAIPPPFISRFLKNTFKDFARKVGIKHLTEEIANFYMQITKEMVTYRENNPEIKRQDFMSLLVDMKKSNILTVEQIAAQSFIFYLAGFETSSSTMTYCMYELSINEDIQEKARQSVKQVLEKHDNKFTYEAVSAMDYLEQCVNETLRKYPVVPVLVRTSVKKYTIPGTSIVLPSDQPIMIPVYGIHHDPEIYPEPEKFDPNRFTSEEVKKRHQFSFIPFGEGPRICIGMRFGMLETKIGLAKILLNYKFKLDRTKTSVPLKISSSIVILAPAEQIFINVEKISK